MRILLVDDDPAILECLKDALELAGHTVYTAGTMRAAVDSLEALPIEAVIADGEFPGFDVSQPPDEWGPYLTAMIRLAGRKAILFSGNDDLVEAERKAGGLALLKPGSVAEILALLNMGYDSTGRALLNMDRDSTGRAPSAGAP